MASLDFPNSPTLNQVFESGDGRSWAWTGTTWDAISVEAPAGVVAATAPITYNAENQTVGINQSGLTLAQSQITGLETALSGKQNVVSGVSDTEIGYLDGVTSAIQTQLNDRVSRTNGTVTTAVVNQTVVRNITLSTGDPSGGTDGDVWLKYTP